jgi:hypothetical protein
MEGMIRTLQGPHHKSLTCLRTLTQYIQLVCQLSALRTALLRLARDARHYISGQIRYFDRRKDAFNLIDDVCFNSFDCDVIDKAFERDLMGKKSC